MDLKKLNTPIKIENIDFRVQSVSPKGWVTLLAYKDARVDMNRLDEVCGQENWQRDHKEVNGVVYCGIGIRIDDKWIWKWDAGAESFTDKEKGQASDSFKRAGFNWGIGRHLYDFPLILIQLNEDEYKVEGNKAKVTYNFKLKQWIWGVEYAKNGEVLKLAAKDTNDKLRFKYNKI